MAYQDRDSGFTLIEVMVTVALLGVMMAIALGGWSSWAQANAHKATAQEIQVVLRQAQQRAVTEGRAICVWFDAAADTYTVYRGSCDVTTKTEIAGPFDSASSEVQITAPVFTAPAPTGTSQGVTFLARGTAWPGEVRVRRGGTTKEYVLKVEGLTGRVSLV